MAHRISISVAVAAFLVSTGHAELLPDGVLNDEQTSIVYTPDTGEVAFDAPASAELTSLNLDSAACIFTGGPLRPDPGEAGNDSDCNIFIATLGGSFGSLSLGNVAKRGLSEEFLRNDLSVIGTLVGGGFFSSPDHSDVHHEHIVDLVYMHDLFPGDANRDLSFDQLDIVQVQQAGKYLTRQPATWGGGDWDGGPGGYPGSPPPGDGLFDQRDIVAAFQTGNYLQGAYAAIRPGGVRDDDQTSIVYDARTGEIAVDVAAGRELTSIVIDSAEGMFVHHDNAQQYLTGSFDSHSENNISWFIFDGLRSVGDVAAVGRSDDFVANDLTVFGSLGGGGELGDVDLIYIPEPCAFVLAAMGFGLFTLSRRHQKKAGIALFLLAMVAAPISSQWITIPISISQ